MAEKIRPPHLPAASAPSQQPLLASPSQAESGQHGMSKAQQMQVLHSHSSSQPDIALHARPASSSVTGTLTLTTHSVPGVWGVGIRARKVLGCLQKPLGAGWEYYCTQEGFV